MSEFLAWLKETRKAWFAGAGAAASYLAGVITGDEGFADVTTNEWLVGIAFVIGSFGITWTIPNEYRDLTDGG